MGWIVEEDEIYAIHLYQDLNPEYFPLAAPSTVV